MKISIFRFLFYILIFQLLYVTSVHTEPTSIEDTTEYLDDFDEDFSNEDDEYFEEESIEKKETDDISIDTQQFLKDRLAGSLFGLRYRNEVREAVDSSDINRVQYQMKLKINIPVGDQIKFKLEPQTGDNAWSSGWDDGFDTGDSSETEFDMRFRRIYLEGLIGENSKYQVGAIPPRPKRSMSTPLNVDTDGWVDGARFVQQVGGPRLIKQVSGTYGQIDFNDGDFYDRSWDFSEDQFAQIQVDGYLLDFLSYNTEFNRVHDEEYNRSHLNVDLKNITGLMATYLIFEEVYSLDSNFDSLGRSIGLLKKDINWRAQLAYVENNQSETVRRMTMGPTRPEGNQLFLFYERQLYDEDTVWFLRLRKCLEDDVCRDDYRAEFAIRARL